MVAQPVKTRKPRPLVTPELLAIATAHHTGLDTRGLRWLPAAEAQAIVKAQANGIRPYHLGGNAWIVASASRPGTAYALHVWGSNGSTRVVCDCPGYYGHKHCWHSDLVTRELAHGHQAA